MPCDFSYDHYKEILELSKRRYKILPLNEYRSFRPDKVLLLRHDVDFAPERAAQMAKVEHDLDVKSTYFVRVHAEDYNPFGFKSYLALREISQMGHEIGLHFENLDLSYITGEDPSSILGREIATLQGILGIKVRGIAAHKDFSGIDNSDFVRTIDPAKYDVEYEASELTKDCLLVSDSLRRWSRTNGRCACQVLQEDPPRICLLTHPHFWYRKAYHIE